MAEKPINNFKTAMNELMNGKLKTDEELDYGSQEDELMSEPAPAYRPEFRADPTYTSTQSQKQAAQDSPSLPQDGSSVLSSDLIIEGNIKSKSDIRLNGYVKGDILCEGALITTGTVDGNVKGIGITMVGCNVNGNVIAKGDLTLDNKSTIIGDVRAAAVNVNGKIKGNVTVSGSVVLQGQSIVLGNISAKNITVETGASIKGSMEIRSAAINDEDFNSLPKPAPAPNPAVSRVDEPEQL